MRWPPALPKAPCWANAAADLCWAAPSEREARWGASKPCAAPIDSSMFATCSGPWAVMPSTSSPSGRPAWRSSRPICPPKTDARDCCPGAVIGGCASWRACSASPFPKLIARWCTGLAERLRCCGNASCVPALAPKRALLELPGGCWSLLDARAGAAGGLGTNGGALTDELENPLRERDGLPGVIGGPELAPLAAPDRGMNGMALTELEIAPEGGMNGLADTSKLLVGIPASVCCCCSKSPG
mmetsp:Transcript_22304/g.53333  ORF Transcript_22304/g.53333 Transcript_22304/m.53333 type:complete len:242 (+) Transcript_22304:1929-2654(+)